MASITVARCWRADGTSSSMILSAISCEFLSTLEVTEAFSSQSVRVWLSRPST